MANTHIIPAIDLIDGKCVRLEEGDYNRKTQYHADPLEVAKNFEGHGFTHLHLVDLDGAKAGAVINWKVLERISTHTDLIVDVGGGIKADKDLEIVFNSGAKAVNIGSLAVKNRELFLAWIEQFGAERMILSADSKDRKIAIHGWQTITEHDLFDFIRGYQEAGIKTVTCTDISKDGKLAGPATELYQEMKRDIPGIDLIASGGVTTLADVEALVAIEVAGIIIGKALYEGRIELEELSKRFI